MMDNMRKREKIAERRKEKSRRIGITTDKVHDMGSVDLKKGP